MQMQNSPREKKKKRKRRGKNGIIFALVFVSPPVLYVGKKHNCDINLWS